MTAATQASDTIRSMSQELETEAARLIAYLNDKVVPQVRRSSSVALRVAADRLRSMAEQLEHGSRPPAGGATAAHERAGR